MNLIKEKPSIYALFGLLLALAWASISIAAPVTQEAGTYGNDCPASVPESLCIGSTFSGTGSQRPAGGGSTGIVVIYRTPLF